MSAGIYLLTDALFRDRFGRYCCEEARPIRYFGSADVDDLLWWIAEQTQASNDQGVDLIAQIEDLKVCIQCKRYSNPVANKAVQEVIAGKAFYNGTHAVVVSNAGFTKAAKALLNLQM